MATLFCRPPCSPLRKAKEEEEMIFEPASPMDEPWIRRLLTLCGLPHEDLTPQHLSHFGVIKEKGEIVGTVGLEIHGRSALLRSLAVAVLWSSGILCKPVPL